MAVQRRGRVVRGSGCAAAGTGLAGSLAAGGAFLRRVVLFLAGAGCRWHPFLGVYPFQLEKAMRLQLEGGR
jgi:hypothetical protein